MLRVRDGEADGAFARGGLAATKGRECGNGVIIDHGGGWTTQYCHLRRGSVRVASGAAVEAGDRLGDIGMSGKAAFPHLHLAVAYNGVDLDPYAPGGAAAGRCAGGAPLWTAEALSKLRYSPLDLVAVGVAGTTPDYRSAAAGAYETAEISRTSGPVFLWSLLWNAKVGDRATFRLVDAAGRSVFERTQSIQDIYRRQALYVGMRRGDRLAPGRYVVEVEIARGGSAPVVRARRRAITIR